MALDLNEEKFLKDLVLAMDLDDVQAAVNIARDELVRMNVERLYSRDAFDMSLEGRPACVKARAIFRKMYRHHVDGKIHIFTLKALKMGLTKKEVEDYFENVVDPAPDSDGFRTPGT